ncbi:MAG: acetyl-CoA carboxylase biotin carboxyl carrier protein [Leptolyngbya sp. SIO4C1]|nr:acetyl-CoA carboxylase biotin carboxyl carrier protein [Leptolyngbya sp. SIO4C1]
MDLDFSELRELVAALNQTDIAELTLKNAKFELTLRKAAALGRAPTEEAVSVSAPAPAAPKPAAPPETAPAPSVATVDPNLLEITSPMVGTFYRSPAPDESPFVEVGDRIQTGQTVCIIEAMKLMNELETEVSGEVVEILVENAESVEFGQLLMRVKPN